MENTICIYCFVKINYTNEYDLHHHLKIEHSDKLIEKEKEKNKFDSI